MIMFTYHRPSSWFRIKVKQSKSYKRLRIGKLYFAWMCNKRASKMLKRELEPKLIKPVQQ